jgi:hypothetical protein
MREFYAEHLAWEKVRPETVEIYTEVFTVAELEELIVFYQSPLGQKLLAKYPEVMTRAMALTQKKLQAAMPALLARIQQRLTQPPATTPTNPAPESVPR